MPDVAPALGVHKQCHAGTYTGSDGVVVGIKCEDVEEENDEDEYSVKLQNTGLINAKRGVRG